MSKTKVEVLESIVLSAKDKKEAEFTDNAVHKLLTDINDSEVTFRTSFARLGILLHTVREKKYWHALGYPNFNTYIGQIKESIGKGRTQLYAAIGVSEKLLPLVGADNIAEMGITKANLLKQYMKKTGKNPTTEMIEAAKNPEVDAEQLKALLFQAEKGSPQTEQEKYFDLGGFYATKEEKEEIERAFDVAKKVDPVISVELPEHVQLKEIMLRLVREFLATYEALVQKGEA